MENYDIIKEDIGTGNTNSIIIILGTFGKVCLVKHKPTGRNMVWK